jgi:hypothetical protein
MIIHLFFFFFNALLAFLEMEHGVPAGKILARTHKAVRYKVVVGHFFFLSFFSRGIIEYQLLVEHASTL